MRYLNILFSVLFIFFALLQYNDPDPYIWGPLYLYAAGCCLLASRQKYYPKAYVGGIGVYLLYALYHLIMVNGVLDWYQGHQAENIIDSMQDGKPWIENTREFGGLLIMTVVLLLNYRAFKKK